MLALIQILRLWYGGRKQYPSSSPTTSMGKSDRGEGNELETKHCSADTCVVSLALPRSSIPFIDSSGSAVVFQVLVPEFMQLVIVK